MNQATEQAASKRPLVASIRIDISYD